MRFWVVLVIALIGASALPACSSSDERDDSIPYEQTVVACAEAPDPQACSDAASATFTAQRPTEAPPSPEVKEVFLRDPIVRQLIGAGEERKDYWLIIDSLGSNPPHGDEGGMVIAIFAEPVSYSGPGPTRSDPCKGHSGSDERVDPDDPCLDEPREYSTTPYDFRNVRVVHFQVDTGREAIVWMLGDDTPDDIVEDMIRWAEENKY